MHGPWNPMTLPVNHLDTALEAIFEMTLSTSASKNLGLNNKLVGAYNNSPGRK